MSSQTPSPPLETQHFTPTLILYVAQHTAITKQIRIFNVTSAASPDLRYPSDSFHSTMHGVGKMLASSFSSRRPATPYLTATKRSIFSSHYIINLPRNAEEPGDVATWDPPAFLAGDSHFNFPADSSHASHPIVLKPYRMAMNLMKHFWVQDSVMYIWACNGPRGYKRMTLYKQLGEPRGRTMVGAYREGMTRGGGVLVLDTAEVDGVVGALTVLGMMRKHR